LCYFFFNDTATTEIYTLSLHDALPIWRFITSFCPPAPCWPTIRPARTKATDRKSTRLNSSHTVNSYAVFCLKKIKVDNLFASPVLVCYIRDIDLRKLTV